MNNLAVFASGSGSNAENLIRYFEHHSDIRIRLILSNKQDAYVLERAKNLNVDTYIFDRHDFYSTENVVGILKRYEIDYIVLAGFLWLIPEYLIHLYPRHIINIHPALLPAYGGKGMYGMHVHKAVIAAGEKESGITIHEVNSEYDCGTILFQSSCPVIPADTAETLAGKIHELEQAYFPSVVEKWIAGKKGE